MNRKHYAASYKEYAFSHMLSLTATGSGLNNLPKFGSQSPVAMPEFIKLVELYLQRLQGRVYGRRGYKHKRIKIVGFFEDLTKDGMPTHPHFHACLMIEPEFSIQFHKHHEREWAKAVYSCRKRITGQPLHPSHRHYDLCLEPIKSAADVEGALGYCEKNSHLNSYAPIICLSDEAKLLSNECKGDPNISEVEAWLRDRFRAIS